MKLLTIFELAPYAMALNRWPGGAYAYVNAEWSKMFGYSQDDVIGKTTADLGMYNNLLERDGLTKRLQTEKRARGYELTVHTKNAKTILISVNVDVVVINGEQFLLSAIEDITDRRATEAKLKRSQESLTFALDSARMGTWEIDLLNDEVHCSPAMLTLWGLDPQTFRNERPQMQAKVHPEDLSAMREALGSAIENGSIYEMEYRICPSPGVERWVNARGRATYCPQTNKPTRFSGVVFDVTEHRAAREMAEMAVKARDNMISVSAHELLTPISGIKLRLQTLKSKLEKGTELSRESLIKVAAQTDHGLNRLSKLVKDMLDISRINLGKLTLNREKVDLSQLITTTIDNSISALESAGCATSVSIEPGIEAVVDAYRIEQVLSNLISNACRYAQNSPVEITLRRIGGSALLMVADRGMGIDEKDHVRIFERFERATTLNQNAGLGLGLFLVKQIVDAHSGRVHLNSRPGHGAQFTVELPLNASP